MPALPRADSPGSLEWAKAFGMVVEWDSRKLSVEVTYDLVVFACLLDFRLANDMDDDQ